MASLHQIHCTCPHYKKRPPRKLLDGKTFAKVVILKTLLKKPNKPNSANRKWCLYDSVQNVGYIPGIVHNLQEHHIVMCHVGRCQDVPALISDVFVVNMTCHMKLNINFSLWLKIIWL
jgi:ribosomal protein S12